MDYSPPYITLLSFTTWPLMPYTCLFACSNSLAWEMGHSNSSSAICFDFQ